MIVVGCLFPGTGNRHTTKITRGIGTPVGVVRCRHGVRRELLAAHRCDGRGPHDRLRTASTESGPGLRAPDPWARSRKPVGQTGGGNPRPGIRGARGASIGGRGVLPRCAPAEAPFVARPAGSARSSGARLRRPGAERTRDDFPTSTRMTWRTTFPSPPMIPLRAPRRAVEHLTSFAPRHRPSGSARSCPMTGVRPEPRGRAALTRAHHRRRKGSVSGSGCGQAQDAVVSTQGAPRTGYAGHEEGQP